MLKPKHDRRNRTVVARPKHNKNSQVLAVKKKKPNCCTKCKKMKSKHKVYNK